MIKASDLIIQVRDKLRALDTVTENKALKDVREHVNKFQGETLHLGDERTVSKSKRHKLSKARCRTSIKLTVADIMAIFGYFLENFLWFLTSFAFTRHKATSAAIREGAVERLGSLRNGHCYVCSGWG